MSLNSKERRKTAAELQAHLTAVGLREQEVCADLGFDVDRLRRTLGVDGGQDPVDVWLLRDYLAQVASDLHVDVQPFTILTNASRRKATVWFDLREAPRHRFG